MFLELTLISLLTTVYGQGIFQNPLSLIMGMPISDSFYNQIKTLRHSELIVLANQLRNSDQQNKTDFEQPESSEQPAKSSNEQHNSLFQLEENANETDNKSVLIEQPVTEPVETYTIESGEEPSTINTTYDETAPSTETRFYPKEFITFDIDKTKTSVEKNNSSVEKNTDIFENMKNDIDHNHKLIHIILKSIGGEGQRSDESKDSYLEVVIGAAAAAIVVNLLICICIVWYCRGKHKAQDAKIEDLEDFGLDNIGFESKNKKDKWTFNRERLQFMDILGEGSYGRVYLAEALVQSEIGCKIRQKIAVKTTQMHAPESAQTDLLQELATMKLVGTHLNVVKLIGACTEKTPIFVIMELHRESLIQFLRRARDDKEHMVTTNTASYRLSSKLLVGFALQTSRGMQHLSSLGIIHRDLAARNILLSTDLVCKIADFGLAREVNDEEIYVRKTNLPLPIRWMAPESLTSDEASIRSDIWSYGVLLWEMVTLGSTPYPGKRAQQVKDMVCSGERMDKPKTCAEELHELMMQCWAQEPEGRPDFTMCAEILAAFLERDADYIKLDDFTEGEYFQLESAEEEKV